MIRAILFDKDGTLLDFNKTWLPRYREAVSWVAEQSDGRYTADELLELGGYIAERNTWKADSVLAAGSNPQIIKTWEDLLGVQFDEAEQEKIISFFRPQNKSYIPVVDPIRPSLETLHQRGLLLGVATMDDEPPAHRAIEGLGIADLFCFVCGADSGYGVKPEPGMLHAFAESQGVSPEEVAMVGDSPRDIHMGDNAGAGYSIGVLTGAHDAEELGRHTPHVLPDITHLVTFLEGK